MKSDTFLTVKEVATRLRVSPKSVYRYIEEGMLPAMRLKNVFRISEAGLEEFYVKATERAIDKQ